MGCMGSLPNSCVHINIHDTQVPACNPQLRLNLHVELRTTNDRFMVLQAICMEVNGAGKSMGLDRC